MNAWARRFAPLPTLRLLVWLAAGASGLLFVPEILCRHAALSANASVEIEGVSARIAFECHGLSPIAVYGGVTSSSHSTNTVANAVGRATFDR